MVVCIGQAQEDEWLSWVCKVSNHHIYQTGDNPVGNCTYRCQS